MTALLEKAIEETSALPDDKQDYLAELLLDALDELMWDNQFGESQDVLAQLADEGNADFEAGCTRCLKA